MFLRLPCLTLAVLVLATIMSKASADEPRPNIVFIMADELAYYELGCMGHPLIRTPNIDQMAKQGMRFTNALAVSPVCASLRCGLMTGRHMGHASVRGNGPACSLRLEEPTIASLLRSSGYATGGFGKWGIGGRGSDGIPEKHGFDDFFGYYDQVHAHTYYPPYLIRMSKEVALPGNSGGRKGETYSHYEIMREATEFIREHQSEPFFCYLPITAPHGNYDIPSSDPAWDRYQTDKWMKDPAVKQDAKNYAAMVSMIDNDVGTILELLEELEIADNTIVFFTGDNGGQDRFKSKQHTRGFFGPNVNPATGVAYRGGKGNLYEGGLRIPFIVRWSNHIQPGEVTGHLCYQADVLPTLTELCGVSVPEKTDGISFLPTLLGEEAVGHSQQQHEFLYWEHGKQVAVRIGDFKGIRAKQNSEWSLYNLVDDPAESKDLVATNQELVRQMKQIAAREHEPLAAGIYHDRKLHERDRRAKFGFK